MEKSLSVRNILEITQLNWGLTQATSSHAGGPGPAERSFDHEHVHTTQGGAVAVIAAYP